MKSARQNDRYPLSCKILWFSCYRLKLLGDLMMQWSFCFPPFQCINLTLMHGLNLCPLFFILHPFWGCGLFTRPTSLSSPNQSVADPPHAWFCRGSLPVKKDAFPLHCHKVLPIGDFLMTGVLSLILQAIYFELNSTYQLTANTNGLILQKAHVLQDEVLISPTFHWLWAGLWHQEVNVILLFYQNIPQNSVF